MDNSYIPFSQRNGLAAQPRQFEIGEVPESLLKLIDYAVYLEIGRKIENVDETYFWVDNDGQLATDFHVKFLEKSISVYQAHPMHFVTETEEFTAKASLGELFDFVEFFLRHRLSSGEIRQDLISAFIESNSAYRVIDCQVVAVGTTEQAAIFERALSMTCQEGLDSVRVQLRQAAFELRKSNWSGSVRESIHAVEAVVKWFEPDAKRFSHGLSALEKKTHLHTGIKRAFGALYGYSSDEPGIRHALLQGESAKVDEADALFMLGACASFVSYLVTKVSAEAER